MTTPLRIPFFLAFFAVLLAPLAGATPPSQDPLWTDEFDALSFRTLSAGWVGAEAPMLDAEIQVRPSGITLLGEDRAFALAQPCGEAASGTIVVRGATARLECQVSEQNWSNEPDGSLLELTVNTPGTIRFSTGGVGTVTDTLGLVAVLGSPDQRPWRIDLLGVSDNTGRWIAARWSVADGDLVLQVESALAVYPLTATVMIAVPTWSVDGRQAAAFLGVAVASAGDVNSDGRDDLIVGAFQHDGGEADEGRAQLFLGSSSGLALQPAWSAEGNQDGAYFGRRVLGAGDVNGDGFDDVLVSATEFDGGAADEGRVSLYLGRPGGLDPVPAWTASGGQAGAGFGLALGSVGDVNGDGRADVVIAAPTQDEGELVDAGRIALFLGTATGLSADPTWALSGTAAGQLFGLPLGVGDFNGDGRQDLLIGSPGFSGGLPGQGAASLHLGEVGGFGSSASWSALGEQAGESFGRAVSSAGDTNGDGFADALIGAFLHDGSGPDAGRAVLFLGSSSGLSASPSWIGAAAQPGARFGITVAGLGDVNGDGFGDVAIGADRYSGGQSEEGRVAIYPGRADGLGDDPIWTFEPNQAGASLGFSMATAGDLNGDGVDDIAIGAHRFDASQTDEGRAYAFYAPLIQPAFGARLPVDLTEAYIEAPLTFQWNRGSLVGFRVEWSSTSSFRKTIKSSTAWSSNDRFSPSASLWNKILKLGKKSGKVYWRVVGRASNKKLAYSSSRTLVLP